MNVNRAFRSRVARAAALLSFALSGPAFAQVCQQVVDTVTCQVGDTPDPVYTTPVTTVIMNGGDPQTLEFGALRLEKPFDPGVLTFTTVDNVRQSDAAPVLTLLDLFNQDGGILATLGARTRIEAASQNYAIDLLATSLDPGAQSRLDLEGVLMTNYVPDGTLTDPYVVGIRNRAFGVADSVTVLGAASSLTVTTATAVPANFPDTAGLFGVYAQSEVGEARISSSGVVSVVASSGFQAGRFDSIGAGLAAVSTSGNATIDVAAGSVTVDNSAYTLAPTAPVSAVRATVDAGTGLATVTLGGLVETMGDFTSGVEARNSGTGDAVVDSRAGQVRTQGADSIGVVGSTVGGTGNVRLRTGAITTAGAGAVAVDGEADTGSVTIDTVAGAIQTSGAGAMGVYAEAQADANVTSGAITTAGAGADALHVLTHGGAIVVQVQGAAQAAGAGSRALYADSRDAPAGSGAIGATVSGTLQATGRDAAGVLLRATGADLSFQLGAGGSVLGGWNAAPADVDATTGFGAAGVILRNDATRAVAVNSLGTIGARSDFALDAALAGVLTFTNGGTLNGYFASGGGNDTVTNTGSLNLRHFADSDGNGAADTKRIATVDFGAGDDALRNEATGTLRLSAIPGFGSASTARQFLPDQMALQNFDVTTQGVEQVHLTRLEQFVNRGTITLRDMDSGGASPVAGDVLLMTSGTVSDAGVLTPGAAPMVFLSNGGSLALDTVLNEGGASSHSDMLVVDSVQLGPNGATRIFVTNAGGLGAATSGSGIKLVDVLGGGTLSAQNAFVLGTPVVAGAFTYNLFQSAPQGTDGDWYLRTAPAVTPTDPPVVPPPTNPPTNPPPTTPPPVTYRPEAALFASIPGFLRNVDAAIPGTRQARLGDEDGLTVARRGRVWARYVSQDIESSQSGTVAPIVEGDTTGYQVGVELYGGRDEAAAQIGLYAGQMDATADVRGFSNGVADAPVGRLEPRVTFAGLYVSRSRGQGFYFDAVLQYGFYDGEAFTLADGEVAKIKGTGGYASLETGYGFRTGPWLVIEPQFQIVAQPQHMHDVVIVNADVRHKPANTLAGRAGVRFRGELGAGMRFQPYVGFSIWQGLDHQDETRFSGNGITQTTLETNSQLKAFEFTGGFSVGMGSRLRAFAEYGKLTSRGGSGIERDGTSLSAGLRFAW